MKMKKVFLPVLAITALCGISMQTLADAPEAHGSLTGQIGVQVKIGESCVIGNGSSSSNVNQWGTLNFGSYGDLNYVIDGTVTNSDGSQAVTIKCSEGLSPTLTLDAGAHSAGGTTRKLAGTATNDTLITYHLYLDAARSQEIIPNVAMSLAAVTDGSPHEIPVYGRISPDDNGTKSPQADTYSDTVTATLTW